MQHLVHAMHGYSGLNRHRNIIYCASRPALGKRVISTGRFCLNHQRFL